MNDAEQFEKYTEEELLEIFDENIDFLSGQFEKTDNPKREFWMRLFTEIGQFEHAWVARNLESLVAVFSTFLQINEEIEEKQSDEEDDGPILVDHLTSRDIEEIFDRWGVTPPVGVELGR